MNSNTQQAPAAVTSIQVELPYQADTQSVYQQVCQPHGRHVLLDSADIGTKQALKSLLLIDAALELKCSGQRVTVQALTNNGKPLKALLDQQLTDYLLATSESTSEFKFPVSNRDLDEMSRLKEVSNFEPLRLIQHTLERRNAASSHDFAVFLAGSFGYDLLASYEQLPQVETGENRAPDYVFYVSETLLAVDHQRQSSQLIASLFTPEVSSDAYAQMSQRIGELAARCQLPPRQQTHYTPLAADYQSITATPSQAVFKQHVSELKEHILDGDIFQVVPSRRFSLPCHDALASYAVLKQTNPSPYMFYLSHPDFTLFGASPESALKYTAASNQVELYPIAGTRPRGKQPDGNLDHDLDSRLELELRMDQKELSEHLMLVDLARNDLARICQPGTRNVADLLKVDRYSHVMHLVSRVVGQLREDCDALHAYRACMNMGTFIGAPKVSAARLIRQVEQQGRGSYGGAVGYLAGNGDMDTCIVIRSAFVSGGRAVVQAGAGVVHDSDPQAEVDETENKARAVIAAVQTANAQGERS